MQKNRSMKKIESYLTQCNGLEYSWDTGQKLRIKQKLDGKEIFLEDHRVEEVLNRIDSEGKNFIQVNFYSGTKILLTEQLIGFKPVVGKGLELEKLPNVVTTPDLHSVYEAIQEAMSEDAGEEDVEILKRVFEAVVLGGEAVGFDLTEEKLLLQRLTFAASNACA